MILKRRSLKIYACAGFTSRHWNFPVTTVALEFPLDKDSMLTRMNKSLYDLLKNRDLWYTLKSFAVPSHTKNNVSLAIILHILNNDCELSGDQFWN
jgi:hypothetical protein